MTQRLRTITVSLSIAALLILVLAPQFFPARAEVVDAIAAVVNGRVITKSEIDGELARLGAPDDDPKARAQALETVIEKSLLDERAAKMRISISQEELDDTINRIRSQFRLDPLAFREAVVKQGMTWEAYTEALRGEMLRTRVFSYSMRDELKLDDARLREYYLKNAESFRLPSRVRFLHVKAAKGSGLATLLKTKAENGEDFVRTAVNLLGNEPVDTGLLDETALVADFRNAVAKTQVDSISEVVAMGDGDYLFKVLEKLPGAPAPFEEVKDKVRERFTNEGAQELYRNWMEQLKRRANIQRMD